MPLSESGRINGGMPLWQVGSPDFSSPLLKKTEVESPSTGFAGDSADISASPVKAPRSEALLKPVGKPAEKETPGEAPAKSPVDPLSQAVDQCNREGALPGKISMTSTGALMMEEGAPEPTSAGETQQKGAPEPTSAVETQQGKPLDPERKEAELRRLTEKKEELERERESCKSDCEWAEKDLRDIESEIWSKENEESRASDDDQKQALSDELEGLREKQEQKQRESAELEEKYNNIQAELEKTRQQISRLNLYDELPDDAAEASQDNPWIRDGQMHELAFMERELQGQLAQLSNKG